MAELTPRPGASNSDWGGAPSERARRGRQIGQMEGFVVDPAGQRCPLYCCRHSTSLERPARSAKTLSEYILFFVFVAIMGAGIPGPGDASLIAAGTLAGERRLNVGVVLATAMVAWLLGSVGGYEIGLHGGRQLLDHAGRL